MGAFQIQRFLVNIQQEFGLQDITPKANCVQLTMVAYETFSPGSKSVVRANQVKFGKCQMCNFHMQIKTKHKILLFL